MSHFTHGDRVTIMQNTQGVEFEPFIGMNGTVINSSRRCGKGWHTIMLDEQTIWGRKFNFHSTELEKEKILQLENI